MRKILLIACISLSGALQAKAQAPTGDEIKAQMIKEWERAKAYTIDYLNTMPANKYSFKANDTFPNIEMLASRWIIVLLSIT